MPLPKILQTVQNIVERTNPDPDKAMNLFYAAQIGLGIAALVVFWIVRNREPPSAFRTREADKPRPPKFPGQSQQPDLLADARLRSSSASSGAGAPLRLPGIRIDAPAHEILGVSAHASQDEIQKAYRDLMKQYHPDRIGPQGSREWMDAQRIAEAINRAKTELLRRNQ